MVTVKSVWGREVSLQYTPYKLYPTPFPLTPAPFTLHPTPQAIPSEPRPEPKHTPWTLNPNAMLLNHEP